MTSRLLVSVLAMAAASWAEVHTLTLQRAAERALEQNPDLAIARLDEQAAAQEVRIVRDPFIPKLYVGSGLAATYGFPQTLDSGAPSVFEARAFSSLFNRPQQLRLSQSKVAAESAALASESVQDQILLRTVELYLQAERAAKTATAVRQQLDGLRKVVALFEAQASEGRLLPIEVKRAELDLVRGEQRVESYEAERDEAERRLAAVLGYPDGDQVRAAAEQRPLPVLPESPGAAVSVALAESAEVRRIETEMRANGFAVEAEKANRYPKINLIGKYSLLSRFNNFEDFFQKFQRHNGQIGISMELPVYTGPADKARLAQANIRAGRLEAELQSKRGSIALEARQAYQEVQQAETSLKVARLDLEVARDELGILLARMEEGRAPLQEVEAARFIENEKWIAFHAANHSLELARYRLLSHTGGLLAALR